MRGPTGSEVLLTIGRRGVGDPFDVTVIRNIIKVPSVRSRELMEGYFGSGRPSFSGIPDKSPLSNLSQR